MKNEIIEINGTLTDLNGLEINNLGNGSVYKYVFYESDKSLYCAGISNNNLLDRASQGLIISTHKDSREAAFYASEFLKDIDKNLKEFEIVGSRNWKPTTPTPDFKYNSLDNYAKGDLSKERDKNIKKIKKAYKIENIFDLYLNKKLIGVMKDIKLSEKDSRIIYDQIRKYYNKKHSDISNETKNKIKNMFIKEYTVLEFIMEITRYLEN